MEDEKFLKEKAESKEETIELEMKKEEAASEEAAEESPKQGNTLRIPRDWKINIGQDVDVSNRDPSGINGHVGVG